MSNNFCQHCGTRREGAGKFCGGCGESFPVPANCPTCGQTLPPGVEIRTMADKGISSRGGKRNVSSEEVGVLTSDPRLVYGSGFTKTDCINCGSKGRGSGNACKVCGYSEV